MSNTYDFRHAVRARNQVVIMYATVELFDQTLDDFVHQKQDVLRLGSADFDQKFFVPSIYNWMYAHVYMLIKIITYFSRVSSAWCPFL